MAVVAFARHFGLNFPICVLNEIVMCRQKHSMSKKTSKEMKVSTYGNVNENSCRRHS
ncbi:hypothetical protein LguiB_008690 [Lonicera macranthoides]